EVLQVSVPTLVPPYCCAETGTRPAQRTATAKSISLLPSIIPSVSTAAFLRNYDRVRARRPADFAGPEKNDERQPNLVRRVISRTPRARGVLSTSVNWP